MNVIYEPKREAANKIELLSKEKDMDYLTLPKFEMKQECLEMFI